MSNDKPIPSQVVITRTSRDDWQTLGGLQVYRKELLYECKTLELPWRDNEKRVSCIPANHYPAILHESPSFGDCVWIKEVPGRTHILIHHGNYNRDTLGCILVGKEFYDIDGDGHLDVTASKATMKELLTILEEPLFVNIKEEISVKEEGKREDA